LVERGPPPAPGSWKRERAVLGAGREKYSWGKSSEGEELREILNSHAQATTLNRLMIFLTILTGGRGLVLMKSKDASPTLNHHVLSPSPKYFPPARLAGLTCWSTPARRLGLIPQQRLAHQVWHRQRLPPWRLAFRPGTSEALHLNAWWSELFRGLWLKQPWPRLCAPGPVAPGLEGRAATSRPHVGVGLGPGLDEAHALLSRYSMAGRDARPTAGEGIRRFITWRRRVTGIYVDLCARDWLSPGNSRLISPPPSGPARSRYPPGC